MVYELQPIWDLTHNKDSQVMETAKFLRSPKHVDPIDGPLVGGSPNNPYIQSHVHS